ncbi:L-2-hydroxycarboxylate dehydrogenase (NAD+) [Methanococcus maripaludis]|uniref:L-2-hydroxycarboxylate dehydrogenase (NAD+) n=1 Tax=Methanococcus maripaludis TaxID=39152 RepID=A0A7J9S7J8_METMI|nr:L-sulfolactate dehydrogenase [Methanococcus maripaludis]MBA2840079.1 L-2-hydroxycarboxylate dehydrogenase (NAD+) [Methanococcus maripaludis]MBB6400958.1 L-2-hydroxycarboxylate dehydrogenase (NAD+) [Methanococcus maripaludis]
MAHIITPEGEKKLLSDILMAYGVNEEHAKITAEIYTEADLKGFTSHGIGRFPQTIIGLETENIKINPDIKIERESPATATINGDLALGYVTAAMAMDLAVEKAKNVGIGAVATYNSNHFGITGHYSEIASKKGMIGIAITNTEPAMAPYGGKDKILGTNPIAIALEGKKHKYSLDMATASVARGKIFEAKRLGKTLPENAAVDVNGNITTNPDKALEGSILPFGGIKGYGIAMAVEILSAIGGAELGTNVKGTARADEKCTKGDFFIAINPEFFGEKSEFLDKTDFLVDEIKNSKLSEGSSEILIPGDVEARTSESKKNGFEIDEILYKKLKNICNKKGIIIENYLK